MQRRLNIESYNFDRNSDLVNAASHLRTVSWYADKRTRMGIMRTAVIKWPYIHRCLVPLINHEEKLIKSLKLFPKL